MTRGAATTATRVRSSSGIEPAKPVRSTSRTTDRSTARADHVPDVVGRVFKLTEVWGSTIARLILGVILVWFGYHELVTPALWTGYVPVVVSSTRLAEVLVLAHGWVLLVLAAALLAGIAPRLAATLAGLLLIEIVISLWVTGGMSDLVMRDLGVLGLATCVAGASRQRLLLTR